MSDLFFYGTLRYVPLLEHVLGRSSADLLVQEAILSNHAVYAVSEQSFPMIVAEPGGQTHGVFVRGLTEEDLNRLAFYEGGFDYDLQPETVTLSDGSNAEALVFFATPGKWKAGPLWHLSDWAETWGALTLLAAQEVMAYYGKVGADRIDRSFSAIRARAWSKLEAQARATGELRDLDKDVVLLDHTRAYVNYFGMEEVTLQHRQFDGTMGPVLQRGALALGSAVVVLPYDPVRDCVLLVEQFRAPVFLNNDPEPWMWEPVAGVIDPLESPQQAARREALEEAGVTLGALHAAGGAYSSSGASTEFIHLFVGLGNLTGISGTGGLASEGEDIRSQILPFSTFIEMVDANAFKDLPLLTVAHWLARNRDRLRTA